MLFDSKQNAWNTLQQKLRQLDAAVANMQMKVAPAPTPKFFIAAPPPVATSRSLGLRQ